MRRDTPAEDARRTPTVIDLKALEEQAELLYLHRFVEGVKKARGEHGRYLTLRAGDELAIEAAGDGSADVLAVIAIDKPPV